MCGCFFLLLLLLLFVCFDHMSPKWDGVIGLWFIMGIVLDMARNQANSRLCCLYLVTGMVLSILHPCVPRDNCLLIINVFCLFLVVMLDLIFSVSKVTLLSYFSDVPGSLKSWNMIKFMNVISPFCFSIHIYYVIYRYIIFILYCGD